MKRPVSAPQPEPQPKPKPPSPAGAPSFDASLTVAYQVRMKHKAPVWFASFLAGNQREKSRLQTELVQLKGTIPLLMKQRNGGKWTDQERKELRRALRSASNVSPYLLIMAIPGSMVLLPLLAWYMDVRRKQREAKNGCIAITGADTTDPLTARYHPPD